MNHEYEKGFGVIEAFLLALIICIIGGAGWFVYNSQKKTNQSLDKANKTLTDISKATPKPADQGVEPKDETEDWLLFEANDKYSIRVPDGWDLLELNDNLYGRSAEATVYMKGTKATVTTTEGGWDGPSILSVYHPGSYADQIVRLGTEQSIIKTASGLVAHKYYYLEENEPEAIGYTKGSKVYNYYFDAPGKFIQVEHVVFPGGTDLTQLVEQALKTLQIN